MASASERGVFRCLRRRRGLSLRIQGDGQGFLVAREGGRDHVEDGIIWVFVQSAIPTITNGGSEIDKKTTSMADTERRVGEWVLQPSVRRVGHARGS
jgi:hypothetical protein